jgi:hypothetical protein
MEAELLAIQLTGHEKFGRRRQLLAGPSPARSAARASTGRRAPGARSEASTTVAPTPYFRRGSINYVQRGSINIVGGDRAGEEVTLGHRSTCLSLITGLSAKEQVPA